MSSRKFFWWQNCNKWWSETFKRKTLLLCLHPSIQSPFWWPLRYKKGSNFYAHIDLHCLSEKWMGGDNAHSTQFLKIVQNVSFNIAKFTFWVDKNWLKGQNWASLRSNSVTRQVSFIRTKIVRKCQNSNIHISHFDIFIFKYHIFLWDILGDFQTMWSLETHFWCVKTGVKNPNGLMGKSQSQRESVVSKIVVSSS